MKRKRKPTAAERKLQASWEKLLAVSSKPLERGGKSKGSTQKPVSSLLTSNPHQSSYQRNSTASIKSRATQGGSTALKPTPQYTGTEMLGVGVAHKSGLVPVFSVESATDLARMRRG
jgi:hypothetical protein